jgi:CubicO group peptidase (beta-lactamase class C family)
MRRREFLNAGRRAALGFSLLPLMSCSRGNPKSGESTVAVSSSTLISELEKRIPKLMEEHRVPGLSLALIKDAKLLWRRGFGVKDSASKEPVDDNTVFEAASMSKPVFAYAVMKLHEIGVIDLDAPLTRYTSERLLKGDPRLDLVTARRVLSHTSGLQNWRSDSEPLKIHFTPGEKHLYSGEGYSYLQSVVTHLTGQPIDQYMRANLFVPFEMTSSGYVWNDLFERNSARPHDRSGKPANKKKPTAEGAARYAAAGELHTTAADYAKFLMEVVDPKASDAFRLTKNTLSEMVRPHVKVDGEPPSSWALGWQIFHDEKRNFIAHGGDNEGFHCFTAASMDSKSAYAVMTNGENGADLLKTLMTESLNAFLAG